MSGWLFNHVLRNERIPVSEPASGIRASYQPPPPPRPVIAPQPKAANRINVAYRINGLDVRWDRLLGKRP